MQLPITFLVALASALTATATPVTNAKRACQTISPSGPIPRGIAVSKPSPASISFSVPANAGGPCTLVASFPAGYSIPTTGNPQLNFIALDGPSAGSIVGTATLAAGEFRTINSFSCRPSMGFRLEIAGVAGSVSFQQTAAAGLFLTHSC